MTAPLPTGPASAGPLLSVRGLTTAVKTAGREFTVLEDIDFQLEAGRVLALVGVTDEAVGPEDFP